MKRFQSRPDYSVAKSAVVCRGDDDDESDACDSCKACTAGTQVEAALSRNERILGFGLCSNRCGGCYGQSSSGCNDRKFFHNVLQTIVKPTEIGATGPNLA